MDTSDDMERLDVEQLAALFRKSRPQQSAPLTRRPRGHTVPLSFAQERLWFLEQLGLVGAAYNISKSLRLLGALDLTALQRSLDELIRRHESLRTRFASRPGSPVQIIEPPGACPVHLIDLTSLSPEIRAMRVRSAWEEAARPFDLSGEPLLRVQVLRQGPADHLLLMTLHHIVADGWSMSVLAREFNVLYEAFARAEESPLSAPGLQYADFAIWQREEFQGRELETQLKYWLGQLDGARAPDLPTDRPRPAVASHRGSEVSFRFQRNLATRVADLARLEGMTPFMVLLAAYQILLARLSGEQDVVVGAPIAGRAHPRTEALVGFFVNMLALRARVNDELSVREFLRHIKHIALSAFAHQDLPFEKLVAELQQDRDLAKQVVFQHCFQLQNFPHEERLPAGLRWQASPAAECSTSKFDLMLDVAISGEEMWGRFEFSTDLFERGTIERWSEYYQQLLEGMVSQVEGRVGELLLQSEQESRRIAREFNATEAWYPQAALVHELFEEQAARTPDAIAVVECAEQLTFGALSERSRWLANYLVGIGVRPGEPVAVLMNRGIEMIIGLLGILKAGAAYLPLDPNDPPERLGGMLRDAAVQVVLTQRALRVAVSHSAVRVVRQDELWSQRSPHDEVSVGAGTGLTSDHVAYVMYTSGSTGKPKGVSIPHRAISRLIINNNYVRFGNRACIAHVSNPAFDAATFDIWGGLLTGARVLVVPQSILLSPRQLEAHLLKEQATIAFMTVGLFNEYSEALRSVWARMEHLLVGGDALDPSIIAKVLRDGAPKSLQNGYGPTEATTFSASYVIERVAERSERIPIGRPLSNTTIYILDRELRAVPIGISGEIYIGGDGLAQGYLNNPALTAERFVPDPFSVRAGSRLYRSGDRGRWRADGTVEFLGRVDRQVKLRGYRVELGEIEQALLSHPSVLQAAVTVRQEPGVGTQIVAYIKCESQESGELLRDYLLTILPAYMVPTAFVRVPVFPLTPTGKTDVKVLSAIAANTETVSGHEPPEGQIEAQVAEVWRMVLNVPRVGRNENFFALGGHSILAVRVLSVLEQMFPRGWSVQTLFENPTVRSLAKAIESGDNGAAQRYTHKLRSAAEFEQGII